MVMRNEEQLNRYFEHGMTGSEEQNFLISVAANDELRRAFRSQLELIKAVRSDKDALHSGRDGEPVARVRDRTLAALGLSATAAAPYLNENRHALLSESLSSEPVVANMEGTIGAPIPMKAPWLTRLLGTSTISLATGLALGVLSTIGIQKMTAPASSASGAATHNAIEKSAPTVTVSAVQNPKPTSSSQAVGHETIPAGNGLVHSGSHASHVNHNGAVAAMHHAGTAVKSDGTVPNGTVPTVNTSTSASMHVNSVKIKKPTDPEVGH